MVHCRFFPNLRIKMALVIEQNPHIRDPIPSSSQLRLLLLPTLDPLHHPTIQQKIRIPPLTPRILTLDMPRPSIHHHRLPIHIIPRITEQIHRRVRNLLDRPPAPRRYPLRPRRAFGRPVALGQPVHALRAGDRAGGDDVGGEAERAVFDGGRDGDGVDAGLGRGDMRLEWQAGVVDGRGDADDAPAGATLGEGVAGAVVGVCGGGFDEGRQAGFDRVVGADDVDVDNGLEGVGGELRHRGEEIACGAGAVGQDLLVVWTAERVDGL